MSSSIEISHVTKRFQDITALEDVSVKLGGEKIYGLLGRNGAGKTTLLNCITGRLFPDEGTITLDGTPAIDNDSVQGRIYYMGEKSFYPESTKVQELFRWTKDFYPGFDMDYALGLADKFELKVKSKLKGLSTGYLTIAKLICALAVNTDFVFFDEPVLGLDANHRELFYRELIESYSRKPRTMVVSTHLIDEIAGVVEHVVMIKKGRVIIDKPAADVMQMGYSISGRGDEVEQYCQGREVLSMEALGGLKTACILGKPENVPKGLEVTPLDLQKLFIRLTNT